MNSISTPDAGTATAGLQGHRALIIGADHGVGPAVVAALAQAGARLAVDGAGSADAIGVVELDPVATVEAAIAAAGGLEILVLCPPPVKNKPVLEMTPEELRSVVESELTVAALQMQAAAKFMSANGYGRIIAFLSMSGKAGVHHMVAPYAAAKGGLLTFMRVLAAETAADGVTVNGIATALFEPQTATMPQDKQDRLRDQIPVGRFGRSEEAAQAVLYLASPLAGFVTGECLNLSGGRFMD
ncbi:SDR family NAD(P)-dependent oxidoreductase [Faunimonas sp. B44]|uniref:SDR family NAD(P)-dependent oxidoreductase n=1 Tax=Faunimonas sp. B44 TaxID=3461493 RepID=UPI0040445606